ncbi:MAG TPA: PilZ domain-containing protein [Terriglobales bacterium]|nr:PilZ domain-containing protein [Terriglobales bacterium]
MAVQQEKAGQPAEMLLGRPATTETPVEERRAMRRFDMRLPATVHVPGSNPSEHLTETQNVSARGAFFYLDRKLPAGAPIEITLTFPPHVTLTESVRVRFTARVLRVEAGPGPERVGIAVGIEEYEFLRNYPEEPPDADSVDWGVG